MSDMHGKLHVRVLAENNYLNVFYGLMWMENSVCCKVWSG